MRNRKGFLAAVTGSAVLALTANPAAGAPSAQPQSRSASARPTRPPNARKPAPQAKPPSAAALAIAATMRRFDPKLGDDAIETIARGIDDNAKAGGALNPRGKRLRNWDEPVTALRVAPK